jgi:hypothetical protein
LRRIRFVLLLSLILAGCLQKQDDPLPPGRRPLSQAERDRVQKEILKAPPASLRFKVDADLDGKLVYLGLDCGAGPVEPGKPFMLTHYFQVKQAVPGWKLFVHTSGPGETEYRNFDHIPVFGLYPVAEWKPGEIIRDTQTITLPASTKLTTVEIYVGIWRGRDRLKVVSGPSDGKNRVLAAKLPVGAAGSVKAPEPPARKRLAVARATGPITIDGQPDEADWAKAPATEAFVETLKGEAAPELTTVKALYDDQHLYLFFSAVDADVWAAVTAHDDPKLWTEQAFEVFIDADGDGATYVELQVNPRGATFDAYLPRVGQVQTDWESGLKAKVVVRGTLDKADDQDEGWQVELALPLAAVKGRSEGKLQLPPKPGDVWRANFYRTDRPRTGALRASAWSPPLRPTFHALDRFGELVFGPAGVKP